MIWDPTEFLAARQAAGDDGKTFLLGFEGERCAFAVAAGLRGDEDHPGFLAFGRYLLTHRFDCNEYTLLLPADIDGVPLYAMEHCRIGEPPSFALIDAAGIRDTRFDGRPLIGELLKPVSGLPGLLRRELDARFAALQVPLTVGGNGR
ncbi:hypothetical protein [Thiosocius teredinicola]|uniref:hypothetical protein n=1 Tax=Thiosocius teredinicola TaxID=1973002 RepID=UPI000990E62C